MTHGAHQIDRMHFLIGQPTDTLYAHLEPMTAYSGLDGGYQLMGRCGEVTYLAQCAGYYLPQESALELTFERGSIRFSWKDNGVDRVGVWLGDGGQAYASLPCPFDMEYTYVYQFDAMLDALEGKKSDAPTLEQATEVLLGAGSHPAIQRFRYGRTGGDNSRGLIWESGMRKLLDEFKNTLSDCSLPIVDNSALLCIINNRNWKVN